MDTTCTRCGAPFAAQRKTARFCSARCRMAEHRKPVPRRAAARAATEIVPTGDRLADKIVSQIRSQLAEERVRANCLKAELSALWEYVHEMSGTPERERQKRRRELAKM